jgi:hypothetical protein
MLNQNNIFELNDERALDSNLVGNKASTLALLMKHKINIPLGFCVTTEVYRKCKETSFTRLYLPELANFYKKLIYYCKGKYIIVRSSANLEDEMGHLFPGIFSTSSNIQNLFSLRKQILLCFQNTKSSLALTYSKLHGIDPNQIQMSALVQVQVDPVFSGVAYSKVPHNIQHAEDTVMVEIIRGASNTLLNGKIDGSSFIVSPQEIMRIDKKHEAIPKDILNKVYRLATKVEDILKSPQDIEWALSDGEIYLLQSRPAQSHTIPSMINRQDLLEKKRQEEKPILPSEKQIGLKGAAMFYFYKKGLFLKPVKFLYPYSSLPDFQKESTNYYFGTDGITIRFSYGNEIGLPRFFVSDVHDVVDILKKYWEKEWFVIIHGYINLTRSFELYLDKNSAVIEHVPGVWESDSTLIPDVFIIDMDEYKILRNPKRRTATLLSPTGKLSKTFPPVSISMVNKWINRIDNIVAKLRKDFWKSLPLNIHFVCDDKDKWYFLNIRRTKEITRNYSLSGDFHVVRNIKDLEVWNGVKPILLQMTVERGQEGLLQIISEPLMKQTNTVYIDFGILSHPAIMLRELGITTIPVYLSHETMTYRKGDLHGTDTK